MSVKWMKISLAFSSTARALAQEPRVLLQDEPTSNLDLKNQYLLPASRHVHTFKKPRSF